MNRNLMLALVVIVVAAAGFWLYGRTKSEGAGPDLAPVGANLIEGLGDYSMPVTSKSPDVQRWFDQGLAMTYGFNHDAAERSFLKAAELDPDCAMCWWGASLVLGPHVNAAMDPANNPKAWDRLQRAHDGRGRATRKGAGVHQGAVGALCREPARRIAARSTRPMPRRWRELAAKYPDDLDAVTLHAESMMDLQPWDYWDASGQPKGHTAEVVSQLESVMQRDPEHAGALHLYVHAVEASPDPAKRRRRGGHAARAAAGLGPPGAHAGAHLRARRALSRRGDREPEGDRRGRQPISRSASRGRASIRSATCRTTTISCGSRRPWKARARSRSSRGRTTGEKTSDPKLMRTPGFEAMQNFSLSPLLRRRALRALGRGRRDAETRRRPAVHAGDVELRPGAWRPRARAASRMRRGIHEALVPATTNPDDREDDGLGPLFADRRRADRRALRGGGDRARREGLRRGDRRAQCRGHDRGHAAL